MGALISSIKDNKIEKISFTSPNTETNNKIEEKMKDVHEKYKNLLNEHGFYKVHIDLEKFSEFVEESFKDIENFDSNQLVDNFNAGKIIENFIGKDYKSDLKKLGGKNTLLKNDPLSGNPMVESTVNVVLVTPTPKTLVFLLTLKLFSIEFLLKKIL